MVMRGDNNERLTVLSEAEKTALYGIPYFDDFQRVEFFAMTDIERSLALCDQRLRSSFATPSNLAARTHPVWSPALCAALHCPHHSILCKISDAPTVA
jgi:hypothetical protein